MYLDNIKKWIRINKSSVHKKRFFTIQLNFVNQSLSRLPCDVTYQKGPRIVDDAMLSLQNPTPISNPQVVAYSKSALELIDISTEALDNENIVDYFAGNKILPGSKPYSYNYGGHQFGELVEQLGDGAVVNLGEVVNKKGEKWEVQLKGAGPTAYSRGFDGRKVFRSSIREFICSEYMHNINVPSTRSATCIISSEKIARDPFYNGDTVLENCAIISRIAPNFFRFGSFEIFRYHEITNKTGRKFSKSDFVKYLMMETKANVNIDNERELFRGFFLDVVEATAKLVASWQANGFCHGVLNTDNMSVLGLTLDYGPFSFLEHYDPEFASNGSDAFSRYAFSKQPSVCEWNLVQLGTLLQPELSLNDINSAIGRYRIVLQTEIMMKFRYKLRLSSIHKDDELLINELLDVMHVTWSDYSDTFQLLELFSKSDSSLEKDRILDVLLTHCCASPSTILELIRRKLIIARRGRSSNSMTIEKHLRGLGKFEVLSKQSKQDENTVLWKNWLEKYSARLQLDKVEKNGNVNPTFTLRNWILEDCIKSAKENNFSKIEKLLHLINDPFNPASSRILRLVDSRYDVSNSQCNEFLGFNPEWSFSHICTCSS